MHRSGFSLHLCFYFLTWHVPTERAAALCEPEVPNLGPSRCSCPTVPIIRSSSLFLYRRQVHMRIELAVSSLNDILVTFLPFLNNYPLITSTTAMDSTKRNKRSTNCLRSQLTYKLECVIKFGLAVPWVF